VPTITTVLLLLGFLLISNYKFKTLFSIFIILLFVSYEFVELRDYVNYSHEILSALFVLGCTSVALFYIWIKKYTNTKKVVFIPIIICISILTIRGVYNGNFINSYNQISVNGAFIPLTASDAAERSMLSRGGDKHDKALSQIIAQLNTDHESVLIPFDLISKYGYGGHSLLQSKLFLNRWDIAIPMLSKKSFEHLKFKCKEIFGEEKTKIFFAQKERYSKDMMYDYFDSLLFNLPIKKLKYLNIKHGVRYFVTKNEYKNYDPVYRGQKYMLYDLNSLVSTRL
jgi:hypothetical protein